jgi:hypothetical protein
MALDLLCSSWWWHESLAAAVGAEGVGELDEKEQVMNEQEVHEELMAVAGMGDRHC